MKLCIISDTHGHHEGLELPDADVLIHCGDFCWQSTEDSAQRFAKWLDERPHEHKIVIGGNHDKHARAELFKNATYLHDSGIEIEGVKFWGSPWTPSFGNWYWMKERGADIAERWAQIPQDTQVLITHGPPAGCGELCKTVGGTDVGCRDLEFEMDRLGVDVHCFGHIHEGYGQHSSFLTRYVNASVLDERYRLVNAPVVVEV